MSGTESELLKLCVLRSVCDDYESLETLFPGIEKLVGTPLTRDDVYHQLRILVEESLVTAFAYDNTIEDYAPINLDSVNEASWFLATARGKALWLQSKDDYTWGQKGSVRTS